MTLILSLLSIVLAAAAAYYRAQVSEQRQFTDTYRDRWQSAQSKIMCRDRQIEELQSWCRELNATKKKMRRRIRGLKVCEDHYFKMQSLCTQAQGSARELINRIDKLQTERNRILEQHHEVIGSIKGGWARGATYVMEKQNNGSHYDEVARMDISWPKPSWRLLNNGEKLQSGDEWWSRDYSEWSPVTGNHGFICNGTNPIRRRIA